MVGHAPRTMFQNIHSAAVMAGTMTRRARHCTSHGKTGRVFHTHTAETAGKRHPTAIGITNITANVGSILSQISRVGTAHRAAKGEQCPPYETTNHPIQPQTRPQAKAKAAVSSIQIAVKT